MPTPTTDDRLPWPAQLQLLQDNGDGTCTAHGWALTPPVVAVLQMFLGPPANTTLIPTKSVLAATEAYQASFITME